jgi:hypothetical protein
MTLGEWILIGFGVLVLVGILLCLDAWWRRNGD